MLTSETAGAGGGHVGTVTAEMQRRYLIVWHVDPDVVRLTGLDCGFESRVLASRANDSMARNGIQTARRRL